MTNDDINFFATKDAALKIIARNRQTEKMLYKKLIEKGYDETSVLAVVKYLKELEYIDDMDFAIRFSKDAITFKHESTKKIRMELRQKFVDEYIIDEVLEKLSFENENTLKYLLEQKLLQVDITDKKQNQRLIAYLSRKGFSFNEISNALKEFDLDTDYYNPEGY